MAVKKNGNPVKVVASKISGTRVVRVRDLLAKVLVFQKIKVFLSIVFYIVWIPVGIFFIWFIIANFRLGAFDQLMKPKQATPVESQASSQVPEETTVPGVGKVNINCVQTSLSENTIMKMVQDRGTQNLTDDEKSKLEPCIVEKATPDPNASASPTP